MKKSLGQAIWDLGFRTTSWWHVEGSMNDPFQRGVFNPLVADATGRYGNPLGLRLKDWNPRNKVGAHSYGRNNRWTAELASQVFGADVSPIPFQDELDFCFVDGATEYFLMMAESMGLIPPAGPPVPVPPPVPPPTPEPPPAPPPVVDWHANYVILRDKYDRVLDEVSAATSGLPLFGGRWVMRLRTLRNKVQEITAEG